MVPVEIIRSATPAIALFGLVLAPACGDLAPPPPAGTTRQCVARTEAELEELAAAVHADCAIVVWETELRTLAALEGLRTAPALYIERNPELVNIDALTGIEAEVANIIDNGLRGHVDLPVSIANVSLSDDGVTSVGSRATELVALTLDGMTALTEISFPQLTEVEFLGIGGADTLDELTDGFPVLAAIKQELAVANCPQLTAAEINALADLLPSGIDAEHCGNADDAACSSISE